MRHPGSRLLAGLIALTLAGIASSGQKPTHPKAKAGVQSLRPLALQPLPLGSIHPAGWLRKQLRIQADGLSGHLDEFWPDLRDNAWIGGKVEGWERGPYWLDGVVPLAYLLEDDALKAKVRRWVDFILSHQQEDGWLGPVLADKARQYDPWPRFVLFKALAQYYEATHDPRVLPAMRRCLARMDRLLDQHPLSSWAQFRWGDLVWVIHWLYDQTGDASLLDLAAKVRRQGFDWRGDFTAFPFQGKRTAGFGMADHGVNNGMGVKAPGVWFRQSSDPADREAAFKGIEVLDEHHGQATGLFTCDEHLAGKDPSQGTELCTVVEYLFSLEVLTATLGAPALGDRMERVAFNALPGPFKPDMCAHQYDQQANQVVCKISPERVYTTNGPDANIFGLEPNYGCCTANMHQGWPKFTTHLWMRSPEGGLAAVAYAPCRVDAEAGGRRVHVDVRTDYPFDEKITLAVDVEGAARFPLDLRIPGWADRTEVTVAGERPGPAKAGTFHRVEREWKGHTTVTLRLPMAVRLRRGYHQSVTVERGPLVFALKVPEEWKRIGREPPFADWEVHPKGPWNYALQIDLDHPEQSVRFESRGVGDRPFSPEGPPVQARVKGRRLPEWKLEKNAAGPLPTGPVRSGEPLEDLVLAPYGCTSLRVTELPLLEGGR